MKQSNIDPEEQARLKVRTTIAHDDPTSPSTKVGWERERERLAEAAKRPPNSFSDGVFLYRVDGTEILIQAERWYTARELATHLFGECGMKLTCVGAGADHPVPRWQVRQTGHAAGVPDIRLQARFVKRNDASPTDGWRDIRNVSVEDSR